MRLTINPEATFAHRKQSFGHRTFHVFSEEGVEYRFLAVCSGEIKEEGAPAKLFDSVQGAISHYWSSLHDFINAYDTSCTIYWRQTPDLIECAEEFYQDGEHQYQVTGAGFYVYSRLLLGPDGLKDPE